MIFDIETGRSKLTEVFDHRFGYVGRAVDIAERHGAGVVAQDKPDGREMQHHKGRRKGQRALEPRRLAGNKAFSGCQKQHTRHKDQQHVDDLVPDAEQRLTPELRHLGGAAQR